MAGCNGSEAAKGAWVKTTAAPTAQDEQLLLPGRQLGERGRRALALVATLVILLVLAGWGWYLWLTLHAPTGRYDFSTYYAAARALRLDPHAPIYSTALLARSGAAAHVQLQPPLPYAYPPLLAILLAPATIVPFDTLARVWMLGSAAIWLTCTVLLAVEVRHLLGTSLATPPAGKPAPASLPARLIFDPAPLVALAVCALLFLAYRPAAQTLSLGQINFVVLLPLSLVPRLMRCGKERWAGALLAFAAMLKITPALLLVYLAVRHRWRALGAALATLLALGAICLAVVGPGTCLAALSQALHVGTSDATLPHNEALLAAIVLVLSTSMPSLAPVIRLGEYALLLALALWLGATLRAGGAIRAALAPDVSVRSDTAAYAVALCAMVLVWPIAWSHHYLWLLPAAALMLGVTLRDWLAATTRRAARRASLFLWLTIGASGLLALSVPFGWDEHLDPHALPLLGVYAVVWLHALRPLGGVLLLLVAVVKRTVEPATLK
jgi:alpha-1,2-mannosyltransferase